MSRIGVIAGVHLDRAWPDWGPGVGAVLRESSRVSLVRAADEVRRRELDALVVLGDLLDRSTVLPATVELAAAVLASLERPVVVVPGPTDWASRGDGGPYEWGRWPENVRIVRDSEFAPMAGHHDVWLSAWSSPDSHAPGLPASEGPARLLLRPGGPIPWCPRVFDLVQPPDSTDLGGLLCFDTDRHHEEPEAVLIAVTTIPIETVDVTEIVGPEGLSAALADLAAGGPTVVSLRGRLAPEVLLPGFGAPQLPRHMVLRTDALDYALEVPEEFDRSARAEFLRATAVLSGDRRDRHQTTALGLRALAASVRE